MLQIKENIRLTDKGNSPNLDTNEQVRKVGGGKPKIQTAKDDVNYLRGKVGRMVRKYEIASSLIDYAKKVDSPNLAQYWAVLKCGQTLTQTDNKHLKQDFYCGSRLCPICSAIRSQKVADLVLSDIDMTKDWATLTLTNRNDVDCTEEQLIQRLDIESDFFNKVKDKWRKRGGDISAILSLEIIPPGYKYKTNGSRYFASYHPHYHILCTYEFACFLKEEWLKSFGTALEINQKIKKVTDYVKPNKPYEIALRDSIREVVKYSLKAIIPKENCKGEYSLNVKGLDDLVTMLKGRKRLKKWGAFVNKEKEISQIEKSDIKDLELEKVSYKNLPVKDTGDIVPMKDWRGKVIGKCPEFVKEVIWKYNHDVQNYIYADDWGEIFVLTDYKKRRIKIEVYTDREYQTTRIT